MGCDLVGVTTSLLDSADMTWYDIPFARQIQTQRCALYLPHREDWPRSRWFTLRSWEMFYIEFSRPAVTGNRPANADHTKNSPLTHKNPHLGEKSAPTGLGITVEPLWLAMAWCWQRRPIFWPKLRSTVPWLHMEKSAGCCLCSIFELGMQLGIFQIFVFNDILFIYIILYIHIFHNLSTASAQLQLFQLFSPRPTAKS